MASSNQPDTPPAAPAAGEDKLDFKKILPIFVIVLIDLLGLTVIIPLLPLYATSFGADPSIIGVLAAAYPLAQFLGAPLLGRLSDRYGRKPVLLASQVGTLVGFLILGWAGSLAMLFLARIVDGLSGANISTAQAVIADSTTDKTRTQGLGLMGAAFGLGFIIGPVLAFVSLAVSGNNFHVPAFLAAGFSAASIALTWFWLEETHHPGVRSSTPAEVFSFGSLIRALTHPAVGMLLVLIFAQQIAFGGFETLLSLFTLNRLGLNASGNAVVFVFVGVIVVAVQGKFVGDWSRKWGDRRLIYLGLGTLALGLALTSVTPNQPPPWYSQNELRSELARSGQSGLSSSSSSVSGAVGVALPDDANRGWLGLGWLLVAMIPASIGGGILQPSINSLITKRINKDERGGILGVSAAVLSGANAIAPLFGGALFALGGASLPFWVWAAIMAVLLVLAMRLIGPGREEASAAPASGSGAAQPT